MLKLTTLTLAVLPTLSAASDYIKIYTQPMEGGYAQWWYTDHLQEPTKGRHEIYVRGEGKRGDFYGVLWLDCVEAKYSNWSAATGYLSQDSVPSEAITAIRKRYC